MASVAGFILVTMSFGGAPLCCGCVPVAVHCFGTSDSASATSLQEVDLLYICVGVGVCVWMGL